MITKLIRNYRSHARILDIPNATFYNGDLIAEADMTRSHRFVDWEHLPKRGFPIIFHGVEGEDMREANSPSWFNPDEAQYVKMYVDLLVKGTRKNRCMAKEIGIITPYHRQVQKIRKILEAHGYGNCKVGSVEEFQGSERPVIILSTVRSTVDFIQFDQKHKVRIGVVIGLSSYCIYIVGACLTQPCQLLQQLGFLANEKRFNVALTRAQSLLIMIGNPFTLENDSNWNSMIEYVVDGGGYVGVDYTKRNQRSNHDVLAIENQFDGIHINEDDCISDHDLHDFVHVSHVTVQEGPAWN